MIGDVKHQEPHKKTIIAGANDIEHKCRVKGASQEHEVQLAKCTSVDVTYTH
jgi:hypothetical protein